MHVNTYFAIDINLYLHLCIITLFQFLKSQGEHQPLTGVIEPTEVAKVILFLASDQASSITGELLFVDGGRHAKAPA